MDILRVLWLSSWLMAAAALIWMVMLVIARALRDMNERHRQAAYSAIIAAYMLMMRDDMGGFDALQPHRKEGQILAEALLELLDIVRGAQRDNLIEGLKAFSMDKILRGRAARGPAAMRLAAIEALACFPGPETEAAVQEAGRKLGGEARMASVKTLSALGAHIDLDRLVVDMNKHKEAWSGSMSDAMKSIAERQPDDVARLLKSRDLPVNLRAMLAEALGGAGDYSLLPLLSETAMRDEPEVRAASLRALGRLMHPAVEPVVARGIRDEDWQVRGAAASAAGAAGLSGLIPRLEGQLSDPVWWVRFQAAEALTRLGPMGLDTLRRAAQEGPDDAARVASLTLAERGLG